MFRTFWRHVVRRGRGPEEVIVGIQRDDHALTGRYDCAAVRRGQQLHSTIGAIIEREDPVDSLVVKKGTKYESLDDLPEGSVVGTGSVRRIAQLKRKYPHLQVKDVVCRSNSVVK